MEVGQNREICIWNNSGSKDNRFNGDKSNDRCEMLTDNFDKSWQRGWRTHIAGPIEPRFDENINRTW